MKKMYKVLVKSFQKNPISFDEFKFSSVDYIDGTYIFDQVLMEETVRKIVCEAETDIENMNWFGGLDGHQTEIEYSEDELCCKRAYISIYCNKAELMVVVDFIEV